MKTITIRGMDDELLYKLKQVANREGKSVNQVVLDTLKRYYGFDKEKKYTRVHHDLDHLFGKWSREEFETIEEKIKGKRRVDPELWE